LLDSLLNALESSLEISAHLGFDGVRSMLLLCNGKSSAYLL
jgi:hypothetical protein